MNFQDINEDQIKLFNEAVNHPLQSYEWGKFRKKTGLDVYWRGKFNGNKISEGYQFTVHKTPNFPYLIGYFPKGDLPSKELISDLEDLGQKNFISFIQLEPNILKENEKALPENLKKSFHPLFTKYTFLLDLNQTEEDLLKNMHQKTRYNVRLAEKKGVKVEIDNSEKAFSEYLKLTHETTKRQKFYAHNDAYHKLLWETIGNKKNEDFDPNKLQANLLTAKYNKKTLVTYILFTFKDKLYYPYGASSDEHREVMASPAAMWGAIKYGQSLGLKTFDMWGAANVPDPKNNDPYYGFHRFKLGFGAILTEFAGSFDLVINPLNYRLLTVADKVRWAYLKAKKRG
jgi:lipid II:glycine glycyltransferase (peptidoglycan interpeptide bridge formation enzyme)